MMRGAIVGLGNVALNGHLPAWKKWTDFKILAGVDSSPEQRTAFRKLCPESASYSTFEECLSASPVDFVDICTPPHTHFDLVRKSLDHKVHVLCEKPLVFLKDQLEVLEKSAATSDQVLFTVHNWKFAPICSKITELIRNGAVGEVRRCEWYVLRNGPAKAAVGGRENWRLEPKMSGGGILIDHGWHAFYLILNWMNRVPKTVQATLENRCSEDLLVEDTANIKIQFESSDPLGRTAEIFMTWASRIRKNSGIIEGSRGRIQMEDDVLTLFPETGASQTYRFDSPLSAGSHHPEWFNSVIDEFSGEIRDVQKKGKNLKSAKACLDLIETSKESSQKGALVPYRS